MQNQGGPKPKTSFGQRLAAARAQQQDNGGTQQTVQQMLTEAKEGLAFSADFFDAVRKGDILGIAWLRDVLGYPTPKATKEWHAKTWPEWKGALAPFATEGSEVKTLLNAVNLFEENRFTAGILKAVFEEVARPSKLVYGGSQFAAFLSDAVHVKGLVLETLTPPGNKRAFEWRGRWYSTTSFEKARLAWPFYLTALARLRSYERIRDETLPRLKPLVDQATMENNLEDQNLHRLLLRITEVGSVVIFDPASRIFNPVTKETEAGGLLALLIGRHNAGSSTLFLEGWVADKPFPETMEEEWELPPLTINERVTDGGLEIGFSHTRLPKDEFNALMRIQYMIRRWIDQEGRYKTPILPSGQS